jgi:hypothetical protein
VGMTLGGHPLPDQTDAPFRPAQRSATLCHLLRVGVVMCGLAAGLVELVALQRRRFGTQRRASTAAWWR